MQEWQTSVADNGTHMVSIAMESAVSCARPSKLYYSLLLGVDVKCQTKGLIEEPPGEPSLLWWNVLFM